MTMRTNPVELGDRTAGRPSRWRLGLAVISTALIVALVLGPARSVPAGAEEVAGQPAGAAEVSTQSFSPVNPTRVMDTRDGLGGPRLAAGETRTVAAGAAGMPAGTVAVALNVTVVAPSAAGYLTVWRAGDTQPPTSNVNFAAGEVRATAVLAAVDSTGQVSVFNAAGTVDVIVDVTGWFGTELTTVAPSRLLDTRTTTRPADGQVTTLPVAGTAGVPPSGASSVAVTVTVTNATAAGYLTVWPDGSPPGTSTVNFGPGETVAATVLVGLGAAGELSLVLSGTSADVIVDLAGFFTTGYRPLAQPARLLDTRDGTGGCGLYLPPGTTRTITVAGRGGVPAPDTAAVALNLTVTDTAGASGLLTVWPAGLPRPLASNLNYRPGQTVANTVLVGVGSAGQVSIANERGTTEVIVDVNGSFPGVTPGGEALACPSLTTAAQLPVPGRQLPNGTTTTLAFNTTVAGLGVSAITTSPVQLALALTGTSPSTSTRIQAVTPPANPPVTTVVIDAFRGEDDSVGGQHHEVRLQAMGDGTYRALDATWGFICLRRPSPPFLPALCP
jgi:hypothetical protein